MANPYTQCPDEPTCVPRRRRGSAQVSCIRPNAWLEFLASKPPRRPAQATGNIQNRAARYRQLVEQGQPVLMQPDVLNHETGGLCDAYRARATLPAAAVRTLRVLTTPLPVAAVRQLVDTISTAQNMVPNIALPVVEHHINARINERLLAADVWRFCNGGWMNDTCIALAVVKLNSDFVQRRILVFSSLTFEMGGGNGSFFDPTLSQARRDRVWNNLRNHIFNWPQAPAGAGAAEQRAARPTWVLIPMNLPNHWVLIAYHVGSATWHSLDSFNADHAPLINQIHGILHTSFPAVFEGAVPRAYMRCSMPAQPDGFQCGVWTIMSMLSFAKGRRFPQAAYTRPDVYGQKYRRYILGTYLAGGVFQQ